MKPILQALLIADCVYQDVTGKKVIAGTFNQMWFSNVAPVTQETPGGEKRVALSEVRSAGSPYAYINLTEIRGLRPFLLRYVDLETGDSLFQCEFSVDCKDPLETVEVVIPLPRLPAQKESVNALELLSDGEPLGSVRIRVVERKNEPPPGSTV